MASYSTSFAKNIIERSLRAIVDPPPTRRESLRLWAHFEGRCAYCDAVLARGKSEAHTDHLVANGSNHISNLVIACGTCNAEQKREMAWEPFLRSKWESDDDFEARKKRIETWVNANPRTAGLRPEVESQLLHEVKNLKAEYDAAAFRLRTLRG